MLCFTHVISPLLQGGDVHTKGCEARVCLQEQTFKGGVLNQSCTTIADAMSLPWNLVLEDKFGTLAQVLVKTAHQILTEDLKHT